MVITGRVPLLLLLGLVPVVLRPEASTVRLWLLVVAVLLVADLLLAPAARAVAVTRTPVGTVRMGYDAESAAARRERRPPPAARPGARRLAADRGRHRQPAPDRPLSR